MTESGRCASCGLPLDLFGPHGLCPNCLLKMGLAEAAALPEDHPSDGSTWAGAPSAVAADQAATSGRTDGGTIGPYRLLHVLGEGGMGVVYLAEQEEPVRRRVAFKVIKSGMDTREVVGPLRGRAAGAGADGPSQHREGARRRRHAGRPAVLRDGAGARRPDHRLLRPAPAAARERLELFITVCQAIQHAHQKGIIHRDLKPSNVLVTLAGRPAGAEGDRLRRRQGHRAAADREDALHRATASSSARRRT